MVFSLKKSLALFMQSSLIRNTFEMKPELQSETTSAKVAKSNSFLFAILSIKPKVMFQFENN